MSKPDTDQIQQELQSLRLRVEQLEQELQQEESQSAPSDWRTRGDYWTYYATAGFFLGILGACTSLLVNVIGAAAVGKDPLELIRVYLTFGMGEQSLAARSNDGLMLAIGCCLYLGTGMLLGIPFQLVFSRYATDGGLGRRLGIATALAILLWIFNFYGVLSWLQPLLFGGNWIVQKIPMLVAALTHLVFGWTMAVVYPWGMYVPYRLRRESL